MSPVKHIDIIQGNFYLVSNVKLVMKIMRFFCCQVYVHEILVNPLFKLAQEKVWLGELTVPP